MDGNKKLIVPLVTLLLCLTVVIGVGYGLTSSVTNSGNDVDIDAITIDLVDSDNAVLNGLGFDSAKIVYSTETKITTDSRTVTVSGIDRTYTLSDAGLQLMSSKAGTVAVTVTGTAVPSLNALFGGTLTINTTTLTYSDNAGGTGVAGYAGEMSVEAATVGISLTGTVTGFDKTYTNEEPLIPSFNGVTFDVKFVLTTPDAP